MLSQNADIRDTKATLTHLDSLLGLEAFAQLRVMSGKKQHDFPLRTAMFEFSQVSLKYFAVDVVAIGTIARLQIVRDRNEDSECHTVYRSANAEGGYFMVLAIHWIIQSCVAFGSLVKSQGS